MNPLNISPNQKKEIFMNRKARRFIQYEKDAQGNHIFSFRLADHIPQGPLVEIKRLTKKENLIARKTYQRTYEIKSTLKNVPKHPLMGWLFKENEKAHQENKKGILDGKLTPEQIKQAQEQIIPEGFEIHHLCPISLGGSNKYENLYLVSQQIHRALHHCMDCILAYIPYTTDQQENSVKFFLRLPVIEQCLTDLDAIFPPDLIKEIEKERAEKENKKKVISKNKSVSVQPFCYQNKRISNTR